MDQSPRWRQGTRPAAPCSQNCGRPAHARGLCRACYDRDLKARNPEYAARQKAQSAAHSASPAGKAYRARTPRIVTAAQKARKQQWRRLKKYGLDQADYEKLEERAAGACPACLRQVKLVVDHCHATGRVRGLLCKRCNTGLGFFWDSPETLERLASHLRGTL